MNGTDVGWPTFKGRPLILNFWATWCGPCKQEIPTLVELVEQVQGAESHGARRLGGRHAGRSPPVRGGIQDELPGARRARAGQASQETYDAVMAMPVTLVHPPRRHRDAASIQGPATKRVVRNAGQGAAGDRRARRRNDASADHSARSPAAAGVAFREGSDGSPVTVVIEPQVGDVRARAARRRHARLRPPRGACGRPRASARRCSPTSKTARARPRARSAPVSSCHVRDCTGVG